jgi:hypothetical protein
VGYWHGNGAPLSPHSIKVKLLEFARKLHPLLQGLFILDMEFWQSQNSGNKRVALIQLPTGGQK